MLDSALHMLGPDIELLTDIMTDLGAKHVGYGVKPDLFIIMGDCLMDVLSDLLPEGKFTPSVKSSWKEVYGALAADLMKANKAELKRRSIQT